MGQASKTGGAICIELKSSIADDKAALSILAHEMGETDYLLRGYPKVIDNKDRTNCANRIGELFSHKHIHELLKQEGLHEYDSYLDKHDSKIWRCKDYKLDYVNDWEQILMLAWALITFPSLGRYKDDLKDYKYHFDPVSKILEIISNIPANCCVKQVQSSMNCVLEILFKYGLDDLTVTIES